MKKYVVSFFCYLLICQNSIAKSNDCKNMLLDIEKGTLNNIKITATEKDIKDTFICDNEEVNIGNKKNIFFSENGFSITVGEKISAYDSVFPFTGKISEKLFQKKHDEVEKILGKPKYSVYRKVTEDKIETHSLYQKDYGTLDIKFSYGTNPLVERVSIWGYKIEQVKKILGNRK